MKTFLIVLLIASFLSAFVLYACVWVGGDNHK